MSESSIDREERIRQAANRLFFEAKQVSELTIEKILALAGEPAKRGAFRRVFPGDAFVHLRQVWVRQHIEHAITTAFASAQAPRDVTLQHIADLAGCGIATVQRLAGSQIAARRRALSDQHILQAIERLVEARIAPQEYTQERVCAEAGIFIRLRGDLLRAFEDGLERLMRYREQQQRRVPGTTSASIQGGWINVDEPVWYLAPIEKTIRRDQLRPDIAAIAWPLLREEALTASPSASTLHGHHQSCLVVAKLLGDAVPDIRSLTLAQLQQAWSRWEASIQVRRHARTMLVRLLDSLISKSTAEMVRQVQEYALARQWLQMIRFRDSAADKTYLSEEEFDQVLDGCLKDIMLGMTYVQQAGSADGQVCADLHVRQTEPVLYWGTGLIVLIMAFTGLRRQSIARLSIDDIAPIGPQAFALAWGHGKPGKQRIAVIPAVVAEYMHSYIHATGLIRTRLDTQQIFFARDQNLRWNRMTIPRVSQACLYFCTRHGLTRSGSPLRLGTTILRRTYVTRALYELPSIAALQAQLGHNDARTTLAYLQHDRFEHPAQVDHALDAFGRKVLARWHTPILLADLPDAERQALLSVRLAHEQEVGMCRQNCCVKLDGGHVPPCSLCEHLVSGPEYLVAWERENVFRQQHLEQLAKMPKAELLLAQMKGQYERFLANYRYVQERSHR